MVALLTAGLVGAGALPQLRGAAAEPAGVAPVALAELQSSEFKAASETLEGAPANEARDRAADKTCTLHLAVVSVVAMPGQTAPTIRIRSGGYISPLFRVGEAPVRIAIPFPAPYAAGEGAITVMKSGADVMMALTPIWHLAGAGGIFAQRVRWHPDQRCVPGQG